MIKYQHLLISDSLAAEQPAVQRSLVRQVYVSKPGHSAGVVAGRQSSQVFLRHAAAPGCDTSDGVTAVSPQQARQVGQGDTSMYQLYHHRHQVLLKLSDAFELVSFAKGDYVVRQGTHGDIFYIISEGQVRVTRKLQGKKSNQFCHHQDSKSKH